VPDRGSSAADKGSVTMRNALRGKHIRVFPQVDWTRQLNGASPALREDLAILAPGSLPLASYQPPRSTMNLLYPSLPSCGGCL
jgi:hypothetical protein